MIRHVDAVASKPPGLSTAPDGPQGQSEEELRAQERIQQLEEEVASRDELVQALTVQLEQLAEQLDRLQRSGADRKRAGGGGLPSDVIEGHKKIVGDLERIVQQWEDMQAGMMLGRIEVQLAELRDFVADRLNGGQAFPSSGSGGSSYPSLPTSVVLERISVTTSPAEPPETPVISASPSDGSSSELPSMWESLKSRMLEDTPDGNADGAAHSAEPLDELPPPAPISTATATPEEFETALDERDAYITYLLRKVRQLGAVPPPPDWVSLEQVPEALCATLNGHVQQLEELLRTAEIELSIERARIGREQSQLRQQQDAIDKQMRRLGLKSLDEQAAAAEDGNSTDRRWVRFLGLPRNK